MRLDSVIGLIGWKSAGKDELCRFLQPKGYAVRRMSDIIRKEMTAAGNANPTVMQMIEFSNRRKRETGEPGLWARLLCEDTAAAGDRLLLVNGIRNPGEIVAFEQAAGLRFVKVGIVAPLLVRFERSLKRKQGGDPTTLDGFIAMDERDRGLGEPEDGQHVDRCMATVALENIYNNVGSKEDFAAFGEQFYARECARLAGLRVGTANSLFGGEFGDV